MMSHVQTAPPTFQRSFKLNSLRTLWVKFKCWACLGCSTFEPERSCVRTCSRPHACMDARTHAGYPKSHAVNLSHQRASVCICSGFLLIHLGLPVLPCQEAGLLVEGRNPATYQSRTVYSCTELTQFLVQHFVGCDSHDPLGVTSPMSAT